MSGERQSGERRADEMPLPGGDFRLLVTRLSVQAMFSLGLLEHPITKTREVNVDGARMLIDDLEMLREKTASNLDDDEQAHIDKAIHELRQAFERIED
jgi:hypothetical protein